MRISAFKALLLAALLAPFSASAAITTYTSDTSFNAAITGATSSTFPDPPGVYDIVSNITVAGVTFTTNGYADSNPNTFYHFGPGSGPYLVYDPINGLPFISAQRASSDGPTTVTATIGTGVTGIGFYYGDYVGSGSSVQVTLNGNLLPGTIASPSTPVKFIGFTSTVPTELITTVMFTQSFGDSTVAFDVTKVVTGTALAVPEPSIGLMFGIGLAFVGTVGLRRRR